jgi:hypothetical protein
LGGVGGYFFEDYFCAAVYAVEAWEGEEDS